MLSFYAKYKPLCFVLLVGLCIRLLFIWWGAYLYYPNPFYFGDSFSYTNAFLNLWHKGIYSFDLSEPDAHFGRLPGYPLFYGFHYIVFGKEYAHLALAHSQALIELLAVASMFFLLKKVANKKVGYIGAILYSCYPFTIVWTTVIFTESLATSLTVIFFCLVYCLPRKGYYPIVLGVQVAICFYVREYLGVLLVSAWLAEFAFATSLKQSVKWIIISGIAFGLLYSLWPIRNYISTGRVVLIKTPSSGYVDNQGDVLKARKWMYMWTESASEILVFIYSHDSIYEGYPTYLPEEVASTDQEKERIYDIINYAAKNGNSFRIWRGKKPLEDSKHEMSLISESFDSLINAYKSNYPLKHYTYVPIKNLKKAIFKSSLSDNDFSTTQSSQQLSRSFSESIKSFLVRSLFLFRTILVVIGFVALFSTIRRMNLSSMYFFVLFIYLFICGYHRQLEMRYLLQADTVLLAFTSIGLYKGYEIVSKIFQKKRLF